MVAAGICYRPLVVDQKFDDLHAFLFFLLILAFALCLDKIADFLHYQKEFLTYATHRTWKFFFYGFVVFEVVVLLVAHIASVQYMVVLYYIMCFVSTVGVCFNIRSVSYLHKLHDYFLGVFLFLPLYLFAALQVKREEDIDLDVRASFKVSDLL